VKTPAGLVVTLYARCVPDARTWDREHYPIARAKIAKYIFCRRCAEVLKKRIEKQLGSSEGG